MNISRPIGDLVKAAKRRYFTDRLTEVSLFEHMLENVDPDYRFLVLHGMGGVGKSLIIDKYQQICDERNITYLTTDCADVRTVFDVLLSIHDNLHYLVHHQAFLEFRLQIERLESIFHKMQRMDRLLVQNMFGIDTPTSRQPTKDSETPKQNPTSADLLPEETTFLRDALKLLTTSLLRGIRDYTSVTGLFALFIDTYEVVTETIDQWFYESFVSNLPQEARIVIAGRKRLSPRWRKLHPIIKSNEIVMFDGSAVESYLSKRGITPDFAARFLQITAGHPLSLATAIDLSGAEILRLDGTTDITKSSESTLVVIEAILENILSRVEDPRLYAVLQAGAILRNFDQESLRHMLFNSEYLQRFLPVNEQEDDQQRIALELQKRLRVLEIQKAKMGVETPAHIEVEIADITQRLSEMHKAANKDSLIDLSHWAIEELEKLSFTIVRSGSYALHDLIHDYLMTYLRSKRPDVYRNLNQVALDWYQSVIQQATGDAWYSIMLEILHHTLAVDEDKGVDLFARIFVDVTLSFRTKFSESLVTEMKVFPLEKDLGKDWLDYANTRLLLLQGNWPLRETQLEKLSLRRNLAPVVRVWVLTDLGSVHRQRGRVELAAKTLQRSVELARQAGDLRGLWEGLFEIAKVHRTTNDWKDALNAYQEALEISQNLRDADREAKVHLHIGAIHNLQGKWKDAEIAFGKAMTLFRDSRNDYGVARTFFNLGWAQTYLGKWEEASTTHQICIDMSQKLGAQHSLVSALLGQGNLQLLQGRTTEAFDSLSEALKISLDLNYRVYLGNIYHSLGKASFAEGKYPDAIEYYEKAAEILSDQDDTASYASAVSDMAIAYHALGESEKAASMQERALEQLEDSNSNYRLLLARINGLISELGDSNENAVTSCGQEAAGMEYYDLASYAAQCLLRKYVSLSDQTSLDHIIESIKSMLRYAALYNTTFLYNQCTSIRELLESSATINKQTIKLRLKAEWPLELDQLNLPSSVIRRANRLLFAAAL